MKESYHGKITNRGAQSVDPVYKQSTAAKPKVQTGRDLRVKQSAAKQSTHEKTDKK